MLHFNPTALRTAKTLWSFGSSECNRVKQIYFTEWMDDIGFYMPFQLYFGNFCLITLTTFDNNNQRLQRSLELILSLGY